LFSNSISYKKRKPKSESTIKLQKWYK